jgi:hypothetical protein
MVFWGFFQFPKIMPLESELPDVKLASKFILQGQTNHNWLKQRCKRRLHIIPTRFNADVEENTST